MHVRGGMNKIASFRKGLTKPRVLTLLCLLVLLLVCWVQLDISSQWTNEWFSFLITMPFIYAVLSVLTLIALFCVLYAFVGNLVVSACIVLLLCSVIAVANYYVIEFHNSPLSFLEIHNFGTALNVMGSYSLFLSERVVALVGLCVVELVITFIPLRRLQKQAPFGKRTIKRSIILLVLTALIIAIGYAGPVHIKPSRVIVWNWTTAYPYYGYIPCTVETLQTTLHLVEKPNGYSKEALEEIALPQAVPATGQPDIILILNESFADLSLICDFEVDNPFMDGIESLDNTIRGYAVVPQVGGGTNKSEYEYLTSNSMALLMQSGAPFLALDMDNAATLVTLLNEQGYETTAAHPREAVNYSRDNAYPATGFQHVYFDKDFKGLRYTRGRFCESDESTYANIERWYNEMRTANAKAGNDCPQFMYCLTMQNHGNWDQTASYFDTVHALGNFGVHAEEVNEYLSCIQESDEAFLRLTDYFSQVDRPVIICMVGDHYPSFARDIADDQLYSDEELELRLRSTPFVIWSNYDLSKYGIDVQDMGYLSMNHLAPYVLEMGGAALSPYYAYITQLRQDFPVLTAFGSYYDNKGQAHSYDTDPDQAVSDYLYLEYANITGDGQPSWYHVQSP